MPENNCAVILAAGEGKRMRSNKPKVLSSVLFKPMLQWVIDSAREAGISSLCAVTGHLHETVEEYLAQNAADVCTALQSERRGTGHAVMMARSFLERHRGGNVLVLNGDAPFVNARVIREACEEHKRNGNAVTVVTAVLDDPAGYGRIVRDKSSHLISAIVEQKDASPEIQAIQEINSGAYWFQADDLLNILNEIKSDNAQGEYYLTDAVKLLIAGGKKAGAHITGDETAVLGANDCVQLNRLNEIARAAVLERHMVNGVEIPCRDGVVIGPDVAIGGGTCILPNTVLCGKTSVGGNCTLGPCVYADACRVESGASLRFVQRENCTISSNEAVKPFTAL